MTYVATSDAFNKIVRSTVYPGTFVKFQTLLLANVIKEPPEMAYCSIRYHNSFLDDIIQGPPVNRAIWQRHFSIFSLSGEGE